MEVSENETETYGNCKRCERGENYRFADVNFVDGGN